MSRPPLGSLTHLIRRFVQTALAKPLSDEQLIWVSERLIPAEQGLFHMMAVADQRHSYRVAVAVEVAGGSSAQVAAALLHDVGKSQVRLGPIQRTAATLAGLSKLPIPGSWQTYLDHDAVGMELLEDAGARIDAIELLKNGDALVREMDAA